MVSTRRITSMRSTTTFATARGSIFGFKVDPCRCSEANRRVFAPFRVQNGKGGFTFSSARY